jgi:hypothetical protein
MLPDYPNHRFPSQKQPNAGIYRCHPARPEHGEKSYKDSGFRASEGNEGRNHRW